MNTDIRAALKVKVDRQDKAIKWLFSHETDRKVTDIGRLASHLKLRKDEAIEVVRELIDGYGFYDNWPLSGPLSVFVTVNQIPDWLRPMLSRTQTMQILQRARSRRRGVPSRTYRTTLLKMLSENIPNLKAKVYHEHLMNSVAVMHALETVNPETGCTSGKIILSDLDWIDRVGIPGYMGGTTVPHMSYSNGYSASFNFACHSYEMLESHLSNDSKGRELVYRPRRGEAVSAELTATREANLITTQQIVNAMAEKGMQLLDVGMASRATTAKGKSFDTHCALVFVRDSDIMSMVRLTLPWVDFMVEIKA